MRKDDIVNFLRWKIRKLNIERNQSEFLIKAHQDRIREIDLERDEAKHELRNLTGENIE